MEVEVMRSHENRYVIQLQAIIMNVSINNEIRVMPNNGQTPDKEVAQELCVSKDFHF